MLVQITQLVSVRLHYFLISLNIIWLPWKCPLTNWIIRFRSIICTQSAFMWWKDCENRSSTSGDIRQNTPNHVNTQRNFHLFSAETTGPIFTKILHDTVALVVLFNHAYTQRYPIPFLNARAMKVWSLPFFHKLVAMATSFEISGKEVQIDHLHPKRFHSVKRLRISVQRIWDNLSPRNHYKG